MFCSWNIDWMLLLFAMVSFLVAKEGIELHVFRQKVLNLLRLPISAIRPFYLKTQI